MKIENNSEFYAAVKHTAARLEELDMESEGIKLRAALSISTMPGEVLGETREALRELDCTRLPAGVVADIFEEIRYVDSVLA